MLTVAFLHALSPALIDAIPLSVLSKLRNFLLLGTTGSERLGGSVLARSHTFHCYSFVDKAKRQNLWAFCMLTVAFLHALSPALIDAIPLSVLSKLRNFLLLGTTGSERLGGSVLARSHTFHCYSFVDKAKRQNLWAFCMLTVAFLHALSPALIDAIPLSVLPKLRNFL